jgi:hypothetical protein
MRNIINQNFSYFIINYIEFIFFNILYDFLLLFNNFLLKIQIIKSQFYKNCIEIMLIDNLFILTINLCKFQLKKIKIL